MDKQLIAPYYEADHDRLDGLFRNFQSSKRSDFSKAKESFREFKIGLQRHIIWEEEILFPLFEEKAGMKGMGPTEVMRQEHRQIKNLLEAIHHKVAKQDPGSDAEETALLEVLGAHNQKEEKILYPAIDQFLSDQDREVVFRRMKGVRGEELGSCCGGHQETGSPKE
ncbi:MAG: hemerythrin domain-containing protein [Candidatus Omnitrophica bacterium]|nr:hemerythrin domain-containing protein [Candidatus Omnitrophota bacterium]